MQKKNTHLLSHSLRRRRTRNRIGKSVLDLTSENRHGNKSIIKQVPNGRLSSLTKQRMFEEASCVTEECSLETDIGTTPLANPLGNSSRAGRASYCYWDDLSTTSSEASYLERKRQRRAKKDDRKKGRGGSLVTLPAAALVLKNCVRRGGKDRADTTKASDGNNSDSLPFVRGRSSNPMQMMRKRLRRDKTNVVSRAVPII